MTEQELKQILDHYSEGSATDREKALLESWYLNYNSSNPQHPQMPEVLEAADRVWANLHPAAAAQPKRASLFVKVSIAAAVLLVLCFGTWFIVRDPGSATFELSASKDIAPGQNKATLTLANGRKIVLADIAAGEIVAEPGLSISHTRSGELIYKVKPQADNGAKISNHTLQTFKGEQHQLILPDGTHVWLNAASSITFPTVFSKIRSVSITGEAYFEVVHNAGKPFIVKSQGQQVEVLGTHFNINVYPDEPANKTTLLEGAVRLSTDAAGSRTLRPGEQASLSAGRIQVNRVSTDEVVAWKNGYFMFESEDIRSVMRKISRWYNVEVVYEGELPEDTFGGTIDRFAKVSQILKKLQLTNKVHFKVEGRRIIVTK